MWLSDRVFPSGEDPRFDDVVDGPRVAGEAVEEGGLAT
jgi:hypothetical protein